MIIKKLTPKNGTLLVLRYENREKKIGSLYIADRSVELANEGEVRASSPTSEYEPGDRIIFTKYAGSEFEMNNVVYLLLQEKEVQGKIEDVEVPDAEVVAAPVSQDVEAEVQKALALLAQTADNK